MIKVSRGCLGEAELAAVKEAFDYGYFGLADKVVAFEQALGEYLGVPHVVATNTGTSALHLALEAAGIGPGDEVIVPSLTYVACFQAISATGARPVACDVYPDTLLMDIADVRRRLSPRTRAVMPVHYAGNPCDLDALVALVEGRDIRIIEDAAHALGSTYRDRRVGGSGDIACFSFDSIKNITCGEGGAVCCRDGELAEVMRQKRLLGVDRKTQASASWQERDWHYQVRTQGYRYHMSNINAAIGLVQLGKLPGFIARRREICRRYDAAFGRVPGITTLKIDYNQVAPHIYVIRVRNGGRDRLMAYLKEKDIETGINYIPNHLQPFYVDKGMKLPETEKAYGEILTLPLHCGLSDADVAEVIGGVIAGLERR